MTRRKDVEWADGWSIGDGSGIAVRTRGLLGRTVLGDREGLWLPSRSVHTFGMRLVLDLVWLGRNGDVIRLDTGVGPRRVRSCLGATGGVIEVGGGHGSALVSALSGRRGLSQPGD